MRSEVITAVNIQIRVWDVTPCSLVVELKMYPENGDRMFLLKVDNHHPYCTSPQKTAVFFFVG
jgi:hypothetical protein